MNYPAADIVKRVGRHPYWRCCEAHQIAHLKPLVDLSPGAHVVVADAEQGSLKSNEERSSTGNTPVERRCGR